MRWIVLALLTAGIGCANSPQDECGGKVLVLWPTAAGDHKFQEVQLSTLKSPYELKGAAAEIYYESRMTERGFEGPVARPNLTRSKGVCVPTDVGSSMALAAYAHMERLYFFDQKLQMDNQLSWPRKVGVEILLRSDEGVSHSNAHYFGRSDAMAVVPYTLSGVPMSLNAGVMGHEHFHAHFQSQVNNPLAQALSANVSLEEFFYAGFGPKPAFDEMEMRPRNIMELNKFVVRGWNEGLADLYGGIFSGRESYFSSSLPQISEGRSLSGPLRLFMNGEQFRAQALNPRPNSLDVCQRSPMARSYCEGTMLARLMYRIANSGSMAPEALLKTVLERLNKISGAIPNIFSRRVLDFEEAVPLLLENVQLNTKACDAIKATLSKSLILRSFSQCGL